MSSPIPLAAPDGTVYAYACGTCRACYERERAEARAGRRRDDLEALAARGLRECDVCDGTGSLDVDDVDCGVCGGTGEVPL